MHTNNAVWGEKKHTSGQLRVQLKVTGAKAPALYKTRALNS